MSITKSLFGTTKDGAQVTLYTMKNQNGYEVRITDLGAVMVNLFVPDRDGNVEDVVLGFDNVSQYESNGPSFGAPVGRVANRISGAKVTINGKEYKLDKNNGENCLHSGFLRINQLMYEAECLEEEGQDAIVFSRVSPDMEQNLPGNLDMSITYRLTDTNDLVMEYYAVSDKDTVINLTNHSYFNLGKGGHICKDVLDHEVQIMADCYTPTFEDLIPTGELLDVKGTPMDFREMKRVGDDIHADYNAIRFAKGYDVNFALRNTSGEVELAAVCQCPETGRRMEVYTDLQGLQLYTANTLDSDGKCGARYGHYAGICFETQYFPNACNTPGFPSNIFKAGEEYSNVTVFRFSNY